MEETLNRKRKGDFKSSDLQSVREELASTKLRVLELERLVQQKERQEPEQEQNSLEDPLFDSKKAVKKIKLNTTSSECWDETFVKLVTQWLGPKDALSFSIVSKSWNLAMNQEVWKEIAMNYSPSVSQVLSADNVISKDIDYKKFAIGLIFKPKEPEFLDMPEPTLTADQVLIVLELKDKNSGVLIGAWCKYFSQSSVEEGLVEDDLDIDNMDQGIIALPWRLSFESATSVSLPIRLEGPFLRHFEFESDFPNTIPVDVFKSLVYSLRLFRLDTNQTCCVCFEETVPFPDEEIRDMRDLRDHPEHPDELIRELREQDMELPRDLDPPRDRRFSLPLPSLRPTETTEAGIRARKLLVDVYDDGMAFMMDVAVRIVPDPQNQRDDWAESRYLLDELRLEFDMVRERDWLILLEGLDWK